MDLQMGVGKWITQCQFHSGTRNTPSVIMPRILFYSIQRLLALFVHTMLHVSESFSVGRIAFIFH